MTATDTTRVDVDGVAVRVRISGPETGPPIVLIHGIGRSLEDWQDSQDILAGRHRVISLDLPGFGLTTRLQGRPGLPAFARVVLGLLDAVGETRPVYLMGNSLGGAVSMTVAATAPERVAGLVLAASAGFGRKVHVPLSPMFYAGLAALPLVGKRFRVLAREAGVQVNRNLFDDPTLATPDMIKHAGKVGRQPDFRATFLATASGIGAPVFGTYPRWRRRLLESVAASGIPALVVWGESDKVLPVDHFHSVAAVLPNASTHLFPATGHMPQVERAEQFCELVAKFVEETVDAGAVRDGDR